MFTSARKTMPALDYVSILRSVYTDQGAMFAGSVASVLMAGIGAFKTGAPELYAVALAFLIIGTARLLNMRAFWAARIGASDAEAAEHWEHRAVWLGGAVAIVYGAWCYVALIMVDDHFAAMSSVSITIASTVGVCGRNFGLDRLVSIQMLLVIVPLSVALAFHGESYYALLSIMLLLMLTSFRKLAADIRSILLSAVHEREEASRLAAELDIAITTLEHGLCMLDKNGTLTVSNEHAAKTFDLLGVQSVANRPFTAIIAAISRAGQVPKTTVQRLNEMVASRTSGKVLLSTVSGRYFEVTISSKHDRCVLLFEDISDRVEAEERISIMARNDTLTGLPNRTHFAELCQAELSLRSDNGLPSALLIVDLDEFKHVNDSYGHVVGDVLLQQVSQRLGKTLPPNWLLGRLGGDEFIIFSTENCPALIDAQINTMLQAFNSPFLVRGIHLNVSVSIGVVTSKASKEELTDLMTKADLALYAAKAAGKGCSQFFHEQMDHDYHYRQRLKADLREAIRAGTMSLAFQPLVDIKTRKIVTCEALARWEHPEFGSVPPAIFIPMAEESGLISELTEWVVNSAARTCANWPENIGVAVNVSARDFRGLDLPTLVASTLERNKLSPERFEIEVTETAVIEERELANTVLNKLADLGVAIALDDFGTGYSSLSYLHTLPFTKLKIDSAFISDIEHNERARRLLMNVARLGRDLDLTVVAEGVENESQFNALYDHTGVQVVQGYLFSRPLPARDIAELITRLNSGKTSTRPQSHSMVNAR